MTTKALIKCVCVLTVICLAISAALAVVNSITAPVIDAATLERETASRKQVLPQAAAFEPISGTFPDSVRHAHCGTDESGTVVGYVFTVKNPGFGGAITVMTAIDCSGKIVAVSTLDVTSETSTLGGLAAKESYTSMYAGKDASLEGVGIISRATITSEAYEKCVLDAFAAFDAVKEGSCETE